MSEPTPSAIPTSADPHSKRPVKKARHLPPSASASATAAVAIENLMADPDIPVALPDASKAKTHDGLAPPPEIVTNVQGSSAGAGSGEFHVYKASRRREYERLRLMDEEAKREEEDGKWAAMEKERKERDEEKTKRNREKRNRRKKGKGGAGADKKAGEGPEVQDPDEQAGKRELKVREVRREKDGENEGKTEVGGAVQEVENGITIHDDD